MHLFNGIICVGQPYVQYALKDTHTRTFADSLTCMSKIPLYTGGLNNIKMFDNMAYICTIHTRTYDDALCDRYIEKLI